MVCCFRWQTPTFLFGKVLSAPVKSSSVSEEALTSECDVYRAARLVSTEWCEDTDGDGFEAAMAARWPAVFQSHLPPPLKGSKGGVGPVKTAAANSAPPSMGRTHGIVRRLLPHRPHTLTDALTRTQVYAHREDRRHRHTETRRRSVAVRHKFHDGSAKIGCRRD